MTSPTSPQRERPLSPHLQEYAPQLTSITSILHRLSGMSNTAGLLLLTALIYALAFDVQMYISLTSCLSTTLGKVALTGIAAGLCYHLCAGVRHFVFDTGAMMDLKNAYAAGYTVLGMAAAMTALLAYVIWS